MLNSKEILALIIPLGGLYGTCAKFYIHDEVKSHQFVIECFEQCHNKSMIEFLGFELTQSIIEYKKKTYFLAVIPATASPGRNILCLGTEVNKK